MSYTTGLGFTPVFQIDQGDQDITGGFQDRLIGITITSNAGNGLGDHCEIEVDDRDWLVASPSTLSGSSTRITVSLGYKEGGLYEQGSFNIYETSYRYSLKSMVLNGNGVDNTSAANSPMITNFNGKTLGDIIGSIAQAAGVTPVVDPELAAKKIPFLNVHSSHMHLLGELERRFDGLAKIQDGHLTFTQRATGLTASGAIFGSFTLGPEDLASFYIRENNRTAVSKVRVSYIDRTTNQQTWVASTVPAGSSSTVPHMVKKPFGSKEEAQDHADATMAAMNRGLRQGSPKLTKSDPSIKGGQTITIAGCHDGVDGQYTIETVTHTFRKEGGITTTIQFMNAAAGTSAADATEPPQQGVTGQSFVPSTGDDANYSAGSSTGAGGQLGHV